MKPGPQPGAITHLKRCPVCGQAVATHAQCRSCTIMIGPGHLEERAHDGLCGACERWREKRANKEVRPWQHSESAT